MAKVLSAVISGPIGLIDKKLGQTISGIGLTVIGIATGNPFLTALGTFQLSQAFAPGAARPATTETSIATARPVRVKAYGVSRLYGAQAAYETINGSTVDVWAFMDGRARSILRTYLNDDQVTISGGVVQTMPDKRYQGGNVKAGYSLGRPTETAFAAVAAVLPEWDASHRGDGVVCGYLLKRQEKEKYFLETYPQGDAVTLSLVGEWTPTYDPRDPAQSPYNSETWTFSDNAVRAFLHFLMVERGKDWSAVMAPQLPRILAAINDADTAMPLAAGGTEIKYRTALSYQLTEEPANVVGSLLACFDGWYVFNEEGQLILYSGKLYTPTVTIGPDQIVAFSHQYGVPDEDFVNEIAIPYVSSLHDYNTVDAQAWRDEDDISERGKVRTAELGAVVPSHTQGRRLAKRRMARNNAQNRGKVSTNFSGRVIEGERYIYLNLTEAGATFFNGIAEITAVERDEMTGGYVFDWVEVDTNADAWNAATEDGEGAPVGNRYAPAPVTIPVITAATVINTTATGDGSVSGTGARVQIDVASAGTEGLTWFARWRSDSGAWNEMAYPDEDPGPSVRLLTGFVTLGGAVQVEVEYRTAAGQLSGWSAPATVDPTGSAADPAPIAAALINTSKPSVDLMITATTTDGVSVVEVTAHDRIYSDETVPLAAGAITDLEPETYYALFYDDPGRAGGAVSYLATTNPDEAILSFGHPYRHYLGATTTPGEGEPPSSGGGASGPGGSGGGYQPNIPIP